MGISKSFTWTGSVVPSGYFVTGGSVGTGVYNVSISEKAAGALTGSWTFTAQYNLHSYFPNDLGVINASGSLTGTPIFYAKGIAGMWDLVFTSSGVNPQTFDGFLTYSSVANPTYSLDSEPRYEVTMLKTAYSWYDPTWPSDENVQIGISPENGALILEPSTPPPIISIDTYTSRPLEQTGQIKVTLARSGADLSGTSSVILSTMDGVALAGSDYTAFNQIITFLPGIKSVKVLLGIGNLVIDDNISEPNENFSISISDPINASLGFSTGDITIIDNDLFGARTTLLNGSAGNETLTGTDRNDKMFGFDGDDIINGLAGDDTLDGGNGNDTLDGGDGNDIMIGGVGNDTYFVDATKDVVTEKSNQGTDTVISSITYTLANNVENLTLSGLSAINGTGNSLSNIIAGNSADNTINSGLGNDTITGGDGNDTFVFSTKPSITNIDTITDFTSGTDKIALDDAIFTKLKDIVNLADILYIQRIPIISTQDSNDCIVYDLATGKLYYDADGPGKGLAVEFATLTGMPTLSAFDFVIV